MGMLWVAIAIAVGVFFFWIGASWVAGRRRATLGGGGTDQDRLPRVDRSANVNPSQLGNEVDLWPDRTGARTRRELGARDAADVTFVGDREEHKGRTQPAAPAAPASAQASAAAATSAATANPAGSMPEPVASAWAPAASAAKGTGPTRAANDRAAGGNVQSDPANPVFAPGVRREEQPLTNEKGPTSGKSNGLDPEAEFGEDRPVSRSIAPDQPPTQWHPKDHGVPGDHYREGHHRSATAPERISDATDPFAHAPVPGPNHIPPESGDQLPPGTHP